MNTKRFTIRLGKFIEELIEKYRKNRSKSQYIKEAILEKVVKEKDL